MFRNPNLVPSSRGKLGKPLLSSDFTFRLKNEKKPVLYYVWRTVGICVDFFFFG